LALFADGLINGLEMGCLYALVALGLCLIFGVMKTVNFAHGEFLMLGAYAIYYLFGMMGLPYFISFILTMALLFAIGFGIEKGLLRPIRGNMLAGFIFTLGLSMFLMNLGWLVFGLVTKGLPSVFPGLLTLGPVHTSVERVVTVVISLALMGVLMYIVYWSKLGRAFRAVAQDVEAAQLQGVNIGNISSLSLAVSLALAGAAGALIACMFSILPSMGVRPVALAFVIVVVGGLGSIPGTIVAALLIGLVESFISIYVGAIWSWGAIFLMALLVIAFRPQGLMGRA
jgi:branched-chain amino acid transport system permease protein